MSPLYALKIVAAVLVLAFGILSLIMPRRLAASVGLGSAEPNGIAEIRIGWGGLYTALGLAALLLRLYPTAFIMLAFAFGGMALTRLVLGLATVRCSGIRCTALRWGLKLPARSSLFLRVISFESLFAHCHSASRARYGGYRPARRLAEIPATS